MLFIYVIALFVMCFVVHSIISDAGIRGDACGWLVVVVVFTVIAAIALPSIRGSIIGHQETANAAIANCEIYKAKAEGLTIDFSIYLAQMYPDHEKAVFSALTPKNLSLLLIQYPELKASETFIELVAQIRSMQDDAYGCLIEANKHRAAARTLLRSPWYIGFWGPKIENNVTE